MNPNKNLSELLILIGFIDLASSTYFSFFILPEISTLNEQLMLNNFNLYLGFGYFYLLFIFGIIQILWGFLLYKNKVKNTKISKFILSIGLILSGLLIFAIFTFILNPIYSLING